jgi:hypothetical protein
MDTVIYRTPSSWMKWWPSEAHLSPPTRISCMRTTPCRTERTGSQWWLTRTVGRTTRCYPCTAQWCSMGFRTGALLVSLVLSSHCLFFYSPTPTPIVVDSLNTSALTYVGAWEHSISIQGIHDGRPFSKTTKDSSASVTWKFNSSIAIAINGTTDYGAGTYSVVCPFRYVCWFLC